MPTASGEASLNFLSPTSCWLGACSTVRNCFLGFRSACWRLVDRLWTGSGTAVWCATHNKPLSSCSSGLLNKPQGLRSLHVFYTHHQHRVQPSQHASGSVTSRAGSVVAIEVADRSHVMLLFRPPKISEALLVVQYDFGNYMGTIPESAHSPTQSVGATRKLMEEVARESVAALQNVTVRSGAWVSGLKLADTRGAIQGRLQSSLFLQDLCKENVMHSTCTSCSA